MDISIKENKPLFSPTTISITVNNREEASLLASALKNIGNRNRFNALYVLENVGSTLEMKIK